MNKNYVNRCLKWLANEIVVFYNNNTLPEELNVKIDTFYDCIKKSIDWFSLTKKDVQRLGFLCWEEDDESADTGVWFIPNWLLPVIPEGLILYDKDGQPFEYHRVSAPDEVLYGCLTFGVKICEAEDD